MPAPLLVCLAASAFGVDDGGADQCSAAKQDQILDNLATVDSSARAGKDADVFLLTDLLSRSPEEMGKVTRVSITVPVDWECEARTSGGQWPCPNGVPSICRYYLFNDMKDQCVVSYCEESDNQGENEGKFAKYECCKYFMPWLRDVTFDADNSGGQLSHGAELPTKESTETTTVGDYVDHVAVDLAGECADQYTILGDYGNTVWGYENWWSVPDVRANYINFPVSYYEAGAGFGLQLYSTTGDAVLIRDDGRGSFFRPLGAGFDLSIPLNESIDANMNPPSSRRRLNSAGATNPHVYHLHNQEYQARRTAGSCHPHHGCTRVAARRRLIQKERFGAEEDLSEPPPRPNRRRLRRGGGGGAFLSTTGSYILYGSGRSFTLDSGGRG